MSLKSCIYKLNLDNIKLTLNRNLLKSVFFQYVFWMLFFAFERASFIVFNVVISNTQQSSITNMLLSFLYAFRLDSAMAAYILPLPFVIQSIATLLKVKILWEIPKYFNYLIIFLCCCILVAEMELYKEWGTKINYKAIFHLQHPREVITVISFGKFLSFVFVIAITTVLWCFLYQRYFYVNYVKSFRNYGLLAVICILCIPSFLIVARGGLKQIPITQSDVFFSDKYFINTATTNSYWNLINSLYNNRDHRDRNPYMFFDMEQARRIKEEEYSVVKDSTINVLTKVKPNIIFVFLESWTADVAKSFGGFDSLTPHINRISNNGIVFNNTYACAELSDQGIAAVLSGFPSVTTTAAIRQPEKMRKLDCLVSSLQDSGYATLFVYGGQLTYGNIKGYLMQNKFDNIIEEKNFPRAIPRGRLNISDQYVFDRFLKEINKQQEPFLSMVFTASTHPPFDYGVPQKFFWGDRQQGFINAVHYSDSCIGDFMQKAAKEKWYDNTLFIFIADHSHDSPRSYKYRVPARKKIVHLWYGNVIKPEWRGKIYDKYTAQEDIPATLYGQLNINYSRFTWSRNMFNPYGKNFVFYTYDDGCGLVNPDGYIYYYHVTGIVEDSTFAIGKNKEQIQKAFSFLQVLFQEFTDM